MSCSGRGTVTLLASPLNSVLGGHQNRMQIRAFRPEDESAVVALWQRCGLLRPWNDPRKDIAAKLQHQAELFLVGLVESEVVATVMAGYEGHRGWINYLAVAPEHQRAGYGRALMEQAEHLLRNLGCPKVCLHIRRDNAGVVGFYSRLGYREDDVISLGKRLDQPRAAQR
jgi:ribosomal protein S18 acetylase RimI-like enzyme